MGNVEISGFDEFIKELNRVSEMVGDKRQYEIDGGILPEQASIIYEDSGESLGDIAYTNEFGNATKRIPERSFVRSSFDEYIGRLNTHLGRILDSIIGEGNTNIKDITIQIGTELKNKIKRKVLVGPFAPNSPRTVAKKGFNRPLIETGKLLDSIGFKVR